MIGKILRKLFDPKYTDNKVSIISEHNRLVFEDTAKIAQRNAALLRKNGVMMRIFIATGGDHHD